MHQIFWIQSCTFGFVQWAEVGRKVRGAAASHKGTGVREAGNGRWKVTRRSPDWRDRPRGDVREFDFESAGSEHLWGGFAKS